MPTPDESTARDTSCKTCRESSRFRERVPPHPAVLNRSDGYHYCIRHRCCFVGCPEPRGIEKGLWWQCIDHASATSRAVAFNSTPGQPQHGPDKIQCQSCWATFICDEPIDFRNRQGYCLRHRCTYTGCPKPRDRVSHGGLTWTCKEHLQSTINSPSRPIIQHTAKQDSPSEPSNSSHIKQCQACYNDRKDKSITIQTFEAGWLCSRHRCTEPGCILPRVESTSDGEPWFCSTHQKSTPTKTVSGGSIIADEPAVMDTPALHDTPSKNKRHSRMRSMFNWRSLLSSRKAGNTQQPDSKEASSPIITETDTSTTLTGEVSPTPRTEIFDLGWHQCHAPSCQERVISEDIWVCSKHLDQGLYDPEDPPGYMDCPAR